MVGLLRSAIKLWALMGGVILLGLVLLTVLNVGGFTLNTLARPFGGSVPGISGYEDAVKLFAGVAALSMFPYCQLKKGNVSVDIFMDMAPRAVQRVVDTFSDLLLAAVAAYLGYMMVFGGMEAYRDGTISTILAIPTWPFFIPAVFSCVLWCASALVTAFTREPQHGPAENEHESLGDETHG